MDRKGVVVTLPFDLLTGYARYVSRVGITRASRFLIEKVYREKVPRKVIGGALQATAKATAAALDSSGSLKGMSGGDGGSKSGLPPRDLRPGAVNNPNTSSYFTAEDEAIDVSRVVEEQMATKWGGVHPLMCTEAVYDVIREDRLPTSTPRANDSDREKDSSLRRPGNAAMYIPQRSHTASPRNSSSLFAASRPSTPSVGNNNGYQNYGSASGGIDWERKGFVESDVILAAVEVVSGIDPTGKS
jgi:hypothetical protein